MAEAEKIKHWLKLNGLSHILMMVDRGWNTTACGTFTPNGEATMETPKRRCHACLEKLPRLTEAKG